MSYYRRRVHRKSYNSKPTYYFEPISEVGRLKQEARNRAGAFVLSKFFAFSTSEFQRYASWYREKHGLAAYNYLQKTYPSWKHRSTSMSPQTSARVLAGVPRVMSRSEHFQLLRIYLPYFLSTPKDQGKGAIIESTVLTDFYTKAGNTIVTQNFDLDWFVSSVFSAEELNALQNVIRYILLRRLESSFVDVKSDLIALHNALRAVQAEVTLHYQINFFGAKVVVSDVHLVANQRLIVSIPSIPESDIALPEFKSILVDTALNDSLKLHFGIEIQSIGISDLGRVIQQVESIRPDQEMDSEMGIEGKGGLTQLRIVKRSVSKMETQIALNYGWGTVVCLVLIIVAKSTLGGARPSFVPVFFAGFLAFFVLSCLRDSIKQLKSTIRDYEYRRSKVFASDKSI
jgi:hypothetical protein